MKKLIGIFIGGLLALAGIGFGIYHLVQVIGSLL